jgi:hypothetical protein
MRVAAAAFALVATFCASASAAPTKVQCIEADTSGQTLRQSGKLHAARDALRTCADAACPALVRSDCTTRLDEVAAVTPSVVLEAHDATGDLANVTVTLDGAPLVDHLTGTPIEIDPGSHTFVFTVSGQAPISRTLVVSEGDKARKLSVGFGTESTQPSAPAPSVSSSGDGLRLAAIVIGSVGLVGLGLGGALGAATFAAWSSVPSTCPASGCTSPAAYTQAMSSHDTASALATGSDIAFIAGGVLLVTGVVVFFVAPHKRSASAFAPWFGPGSGGFVFRGAF